MEARFDLFDSETATKFAKRFYGVGSVLEQSSLPKATRELVMLRVSQINGCSMCIDIHTKEAAAAGEEAVRLHQVAAWRESTVFSEAERAALALAEEGTRLADAHEGVSDETWARGARALRRRRDGRAGRADRDDQRGQPDERDRAYPGRFLRAGHDEDRARLIRSPVVMSAFCPGDVLRRC